jgi:hypothetical protein
MLQREEEGERDEYDARSALGILLEPLPEDLAETQAGKREDDRGYRNRSDERDQRHTKSRQ